MELRVIAYAHNGHTDKFGIPRQSREESPILTRIVFEPEFAVKESLRGIEGYSHLWLIWGFSEQPAPNPSPDGRELSWSPTVRPPRLGGNKRVGVFATRSPFRPNHLGLSSVRLVEVKDGELIVSGADLLDGTPIYDIKPYLSFSDCHEDAKNGFAEETKDYHLSVDWHEMDLKPVKQPTNNLLITYYSPTNDILLTAREKEALEYILSQDPRPGYQDDSTREYKLDFGGRMVTFVVDKQTVIVKKVKKL